MIAHTSHRCWVETGADQDRAVTAMQDERAWMAVISVASGAS
jgi:hypothetical protein